MPIASAPVSPPIDHVLSAGSTMLPMQPPPICVSDSFAKDAFISWIRTEFAAANAIIDTLCSHLALLAKLADASSDYDSVFDAIHRRRHTWVPILQMQKYDSIADVTWELRKVAGKKTGTKEIGEGERRNEDLGNQLDEKTKIEEKGMGTSVNSEGDECPEEYDSPNSEITDSGCQEVQGSLTNINICSKHEECQGRSSQMTLRKGFQAKETVRGHMVNVVKGLKLYEDIFTEHELSKLTDFVNELHAAGKNGKLSGETFILFNKQMKGNKRELIQLGVPIFGQIKEDANSNIEPIPSLLQSVIDHLIQWRLLPEYRRPDGCIINFFEEGEYSQPFLKPPHLDQPLSTLLLSESTMAFGRTLTSENDGNYKGPLMLSLKKGSLLVMRGNSADMARHVMCPSPNRRVSITFFRTRSNSNQCQSPTPSMVMSAMTFWKPGISGPYALPSVPPSGPEAMGMMPQWGILRAPLVMLAPVSTRELAGGGGTGVFLPWNVPSRKPAKHLPPRAQRARLLALPSSVESHISDSSSEPSVSA
ncbi:RNA demethylase ALKBH10B-like [Prosopis cineraria]|uniref:RNA demethylase ALKBH10B-like n=1 Tax=Prosopis cineraria TaxID=364024 RepID=UPI002410182F|nr:RNA demethylase ALKBH10B-like [Prosopis cineraria]